LINIIIILIKSGVGFNFQIELEELIIF